MKTSFVAKITSAGFGLLFALVLSSSTFAGPSQQYFQQQERLRAERAAKATVATPAATTPAPQEPACPNCKTSNIEEFSGTNGPGRFAPHYTVVGKKHECATCGGMIKTVRGNTTDEMTANCPTCTKAKAAGAACCGTTS